MKKVTALLMFTFITLSVVSCDLFDDSDIVKSGEDEIVAPQSTDPDEDPETDPPGGGFN